MIDVMIRAETRARFRTFAINRNLVVQQGSIYIVQPNVDIDEIGNAVITPAVLNPDGTVQTPAVLDTWWLVNVRLSHGMAANDEDTLYTGETDTGFKFTKSRFVRFVREQSTQVVSPWGGRAYQFGTTPNRIQLLDPRDAQHSPKRVWLGGMNL
jgi:hypothetical protein